MTAVPRGPGAPARRSVLRAAAGAAAGGAVSGCAGGAADGVAADGTVTIQVWHGQTDTALKVVKSLVAAFHRTHPDIRVDLGGGVLADAMLQKATAALASGAYPDVAFVFGSDLASVARSPKVVDLTSYVRARRTPWASYWPSARAAVTINGQVRAMPAVVDCLAMVCNKKVFARAGVELPEPGWSWDDFTDLARRLTDAGEGRFGTGWPAAGDEDTVWRLWPLIWGLGGEVIAEDGKHIGFTQEGVRALEVLRGLVRDKSVYVDPKPAGEQMYKVFLSGRMAMVPTGPWQLPDILQAKLDYHVVPLPTFDGDPVTISGPDTWTVFDNGEHRARAARTFVSWLTSPAQDSRWDVEAGSLPLSRGSEDSPAWREHATRTRGLSVFTEALASARVRPVHPAYPSISLALGQAIVSVLLDRASPRAAIRACAEDANAALLIPR
ncbi:ABC transporter substrate-binding protein [Streptomyces sp. YIM 130001]|uniref:ABC transporter substrate-binding protein n=1 Tax=Streptomyces sp. YIM 130001 TaxID=2259644 RepID=UPI000E653C77|nr:ABC transporter substrate-binding protein [Streptomyces sp. YIM 130001]